jgi:exocyst complex component 1
MDLEMILIGEVKALEDASIYAIIESDDRVGIVVRHIDETLAELKRLEQMMGLYKTQLLEDHL